MMCAYRARFNDSAPVDLTCARVINVTSAGAEAAAQNRPAAFILETTQARLNAASSVHESIFIGNATFHRINNNVICCVSSTINAAGDVVVALAFDIIFTVRSLLTLPAMVPSYQFEVPDFADAVADLHIALCELSCAITRYGFFV
jgi:hypothetical protein